MFSFFGYATRTKKVLSWENAHLPRCHELGTRAASSLCHRMFALLRRSHTLWRLRVTCMMRLVLYMHNANHRMNACHPTPPKRGLASGVKTSGKSCRTIRMLHERATRFNIVSALEDCINLHLFTEHRNPSSGEETAMAWHPESEYTLSNAHHS